MNYENIIELLLNEFPNLKERLETEDYLNSLPHCIFEIVLIPYVKKLCEDLKKEELNKLGIFLERMELCEDIKVKELFNVSFLEPIILGEKELLTVLQNYLGRKSLEELGYWEKRYK